ncbi:MAG: hypothetical protein AAFR04_14205 [Pseudomonadota bacterium]
MRHNFAAGERIAAWATIGKPMAAAILIGMGILASPVAMSGTAVAQDSGLAGMHAWTTVRGRTCMADHYHSGQGSGASKRGAMRAAIQAWRDFTGWEYGSRWASYRRAVSKGVSCGRAGSGWSCSVEARPCYVGRRRARR